PHRLPVEELVIPTGRRSVPDGERGGGGRGHGAGRDVSDQGRSGAAGASAAGRRRSRVRGYPSSRASSLSTFATSTGPGVWPMVSKRAGRRASASLAFTGKRS